jgi:hypothetical protein
VCGIIALLRGPGPRVVLDPAEVLEPLSAVQELLRGVDPVASAEAAAAVLEQLDALLRSTDGVALLVRDRALTTRAASVGEAVADWIAATEAKLDAQGPPEDRSLEDANAALLRLKDARWAVMRDRLPTATAVRELVGADPSWSAIEVVTSI